MTDPNQPHLTWRRIVVLNGAANGNGRWSPQQGQALVTVRLERKGYLQQSGSKGTWPYVCYRITNAGREKLREIRNLFGCGHLVWHEIDTAKEDRQ